MSGLLSGGDAQHDEALIISPSLDMMQAIDHADAREREAGDAHGAGGGFLEMRASGT